MKVTAVLFQSMAFGDIGVSVVVPLTLSSVQADRTAQEIEIAVLQYSDLHV